MGERYTPSRKPVKHVLRFNALLGGDALEAELVLA